AAAKSAGDLGRNDTAPPAAISPAKIGKIAKGVQLASAKASTAAAPAPAIRCHGLMGGQSSSEARLGSASDMAANPLRPRLMKRWRTAARQPVQGCYGVKDTRSMSANYGQCSKIVAASLPVSSHAQGNCGPTDSCANCLTHRPR